ncbi:activating transcription factor 3 [Planococcus citri]|uniref:activating transcription factor 3 n=1 Tax=Planococcus citri TaxID=170843 RepID=UPI0031F7CB30
MYNLNDMSCAPGAEFDRLSVSQGDNTTTPKTPEIINSIMALTNPFEYVRGGSGRAEDKILSPSEYASADTCSSTSSNVDSPTSPPRVQSMCSQLIKEELKLTLQKKRQNTLSSSENDSNASTPVNSIGIGAIADKFAHRNDESSFDDEDDSSMNGDFNGSLCGLTPEDEERRRRRRERNKIAATKCRQKKREKTNHLVHESEELEDQNQKLRSQIQELEVQKRSLMGMLTYHKPTCMKPSPEQSPVVDYQQPPLFSNSTNYQPSASFIRNDDNKLNDQRSALVCQETAIIPDLHHLDTFDFQDVLKNPSVMLSTTDNQYNDHSTLKNKYNNNNYKNADKCFPIRHSMSINANNYKNNGATQLPNYNFLDDPMSQDHFDSLHFNNTGNGCIV